MHRSTCFTHTCQRAAKPMKLDTPGHIAGPWHPVQIARSLHTICLCHHISDGIRCLQGNVTLYNLDASVSLEKLYQSFVTFGDVKDIHSAAGRPNAKLIEFYDGAQFVTCCCCCSLAQCGCPWSISTPSRPFCLPRPGRFCWELRVTPVRLYD